LVSLIAIGPGEPIEPLIKRLVLETIEQVREGLERDSAGGV
jgi:hypothetical protein